jgi:AcrR family transcriptional regulator
MAKEALQKIDAKKRERIFRNASAEFARHGYHSASVNSIAERAGIGKGSIYLYFDDKRDLYHSTLLEGARMLDGAFDEIKKSDLGAMAKIERVFADSVEAFPRFRNMVKMYFDLMSSSGDDSPVDFVRALEIRSAEFFKTILREGVKAGDIREDLPVEHAAYIIDSIYTLFLISLARGYHRERFRVFTNERISRKNGIFAGHLDKILDVLRGGIEAPLSVSPKKRVTAK